MQPLKVYIATTLTRAALHNQVRDALAALDVQLTYDWTVHGAVAAQGKSVLREVATLEARGVRDADCVVVLLPGGKGTHTELGMALALGKPIVLHSPTPDQHYEAHPETCAFYHHPGIVHALVDPERWAEGVAVLAARYARAYRDEDPFGHPRE